MSEAEAAAIIDQFTKSGQLKDMLALDPLLARLRRSITDTRVSGGLLAPDAVSTVYEHWVPMQNGEDFNHPLIIIATSLTLSIVISGFILLAIRLGRDWKSWRVQSRASRGAGTT